MSSTGALETATAPRWSHPVRPATPPMDPDALRMLLRKVQTWQPYVDGLLLDDVAAVLDDHMPAEDELGDSALRLRGHLMRLVNLAVAAQVVHQDARVAVLVDQARAVRSEDTPGDHWKAVGHVRRMAWTLNELLDRLVENQCLKEAV